MRHAALFTIGNHADERADFGAQAGPRANFAPSRTSRVPIFTRTLSSFDCFALIFLSN
jgi:hypothetical protein